jgi:predicted nucleotidyltransferase component of viral defense system
MNLSVLHQRLLQDVMAIGNAFPLVLTGGYAVQAHGLVERLSRDVDVATNSNVPMASIAAALIDGLVQRGWEVEVIGIDPLSARLMVTDPAIVGQSSELDILKEAFDPPPHTTSYGPVLPLDAVIGTKVRALAGRGLPRDLIDIHAASKLRSNAELEALGERYARDDEFSLIGLADRLEGTEWYDDQAFAEYGISAADIASIRRWAQEWSDDIRRRMYQAVVDEDEEEELP